MRGYIPLRPVGTTPEALGQQAIWDATYGPASKLNQSSTVKIDSTTRGFNLRAAAPGGGGSSLVPMVVTSLYGTDFIGARRVNPSTTYVQGGTVYIQPPTAPEIYVAKAVYARMLNMEWIDNIAFTYGYTGDNFRVQYLNAATYEYHVCHPRYRIFNNDKPDLRQYLIFASKVSGGSGVRDLAGNLIYWQEDGERFWAYQYGQSGPPS